MARLFADQGYLRKAAEIYQQLLGQQPERTELRQALAAVESRIANQPAPSRKELGLMLREWKGLLEQRHGFKRGEPGGRK